MQQISASIGVLAQLVSYSFFSLYIDLKELPLFYIKMFDFYVVEAHNLMYMVLGMTDLFSSIIIQPN